ncbi:MAG TPA: bifunctional UDP-sugar hydrolase/5'-nucleotidase [Armatimonadaceae bacterium]|nr:bifunctional UDP-sugar hydrolase/5'-nucleotidase [Armatimonadaceae bacterium]
MPSSRRDFLRLLAATPVVVASWTSPLLAAGLERKAPVKHFVLLHSNDPHGHLMPFSFQDRTAPGDYLAYMPARKSIGGIARRAALIKDIKKREKNVYAFDAGDSMDGSPFSLEFLGKADYDANSLAGFDYGTFGNHDFNMSAAQFREMRERIKYKMVLANVYEKGTRNSIEKPYLVENWDGLKVGILGVTTYSSRTYKAITDAYEMREPMSVASDLVPILRNQADLVIVLAHDGYDEDVRMARDIPGIDVIIGAHSHTRLPVGDYELAARPGKRDPQGAVIVQAHCWGGELGRLDIDAMQMPDGHWRVVRYTAQLLPVTEDVPEDRAVKQVVDGYWKRIEGKYAEVVGEAADEFADGGDEDPTNYYLMTDAIHAAFPDADFEIENFGGVRAPILRGKITRSSLIEVDPFTNTIVSFKIKGADLKKVLAYTRPAPSATLRYHAKAVARPDGKKEWELVSAALKGQPIEDEKVYQGVASSYYFNFGIKRYAIDPVDSGKPRLEYLAAYIKKNSPIRPTPDGRLRFEDDTKIPD